MLFSRLRRLQNTNQNCSPVAVRGVGVCTTGRGVAAGARMYAEPPTPKSRLFHVLAEPRRGSSAQQVRFRVMLANLADRISRPDPTGPPATTKFTTPTPCNTHPMPMWEELMMGVGGRVREGSLRTAVFGKQRKRCFFRAKVFCGGGV